MKCAGLIQNWKSISLSTNCLSMSSWTYRAKDFACMPLLSQSGFKWPRVSQSLLEMKLSLALKRVLCSLRLHFQCQVKFHDSVCEDRDTFSRSTRRFYHFPNRNVMFHQSGLTQDCRYFSWSPCWEIISGVVSFHCIFMDVLIRHGMMFHI